MVDALVRLMAAPDGMADPVNLGNPRECTMVELARCIVGLCGSRSTLAYQALPADDPVRRLPDISRARAVLGWSPQIDLEQGLLRTIDYFRKRLGPAAQNGRQPAAPAAPAPARPLRVAAGPAGEDRA